jgi:hypothetical protein
MGYTALTRHRDSAKFYVVSPGTAERALPGLEPESDPVADDVAATLEQRQRKTIAIDMLLRAASRDDVRAPDRTRAIREAERRIAAMTREREDAGPWRRARRKELDQLIERQQEAIDRWSLAKSAEPLDRPIREAIAYESRSSLDADEVRAVVIAPPRPIVSQVGTRPETLADREQWCRAVARLVGEPLPSADPTDLGRSMYDTGMEL